ncbi:MAG: calcineurin [Eubacterium sp.]|nr:calcineurin [Eubacterium sp.]
MYHELFAQMYLEGRLDGRTWDFYGGVATHRQIDALETADKQELLEYLTDLELYTKMDSPVYGGMILTHTGIDHECVVMSSDGRVDVARSIIRGYENDDFHFLVGNDIHFLTRESLELLDHYIVTGHVCTFNVNPDGSNKAYVTPYFMDIDCGCGHKDRGGILCCYCVDTNEFQYI